MSNIKIISSEENLINIVATELSNTTDTVFLTKDYSKSIVVFPWKRPAHYLRKALAENRNINAKQVIANATPFFPPQIFSIDEFIEHLYVDILGYQHKTLEAIDAVALLYDIHLQAEQISGSERINTETAISLHKFDDFLPIAFKLLNELEEAMLADLSVKRIREVLQDVEYARFHSFADYYEKFYEQVEYSGFVTRSMKYRTIADEIDKGVASNLSGYNKIIFAGFYAFTNVEKRLIANLKKQDNVCFIFQDGVGLMEQIKFLDSPLFVEAIQDREKELSKPEIYFYKAPDLHGQIFALSAQLSSRGTTSEDIAIIIPSADALFPIIHFPLSLLKEDQYNIALGYPINRTPVYGFIQNLMDLIITSYKLKFSLYSYLRFALHPYIKNIYFNNRSDITRILFHQLEEHLVKKKTRVLLSLEDIEQDDEFFEQCRLALKGIANNCTSEQLKQHIKTIHNNTIRKLLDIQSIGDYTVTLIKLIEYIFENSTAKRHPYFKPYTERLIELLDKASHSLLQERKFQETASYLKFLHHYLEGQTIPFHGTPLHGLQILGHLEPRNLKFDTVYFLDANDDIIPGKPSDNLFLKQPIRKMLGLETFHERERLIEYYFDLVVYGAKKVHLFYTENQKAEKSRFVQKLLWERQQIEKTADFLSFEKKILYCMNLINPGPSTIKKTDDVIRFVREENRFSASQLDVYLKCQLKFYYQFVLRLREQEEIADDIDNAQIGTLIHKILEEYFKPFIDKRISKEQLTQYQLNDVIYRIMEIKYGKELPAPTQLMRIQIKYHLWEFIEKYQKEDIVIKGLERKISIEKNGIKWTGKIDRIEQRDEQIFILDYKTGSSDKYININLNKLDINNRESYQGAIGSFQLPVYMLLYANETNIPLEKITPAYLFLGKNRIDEEIEVALEKGVYDKIEPVIFRLIDEIFDKNKDFLPTNIGDGCSDCSYNTICSTKSRKKEY